MCGLFNGFVRHCLGDILHEGFPKLAHEFHSDRLAGSSALGSLFSSVGALTTACFLRVWLS